MAKTTPQNPGNESVNIADILKKAKGAWKEGKAKAKDMAKGGDFPTFEDGRYITRLVNASVGVSKAGRPQVIWAFQFLGSDYDGQKIRDYSGLNDPQNIAYLIARLGDLGYADPDPDKLVEILTEIEKDKPTCRIRVKTKGAYQNVYIDKVYSEDEEAELAAQDEEEEEVAVDTEDDDDDDEEEAEDEAEEDGEESDDEETESEESDDEEEEEAVEEEEDEDDEDEDEPVMLTTGMKVRAQTKAGEKLGTITGLHEAEGKVTIKLKDGTLLKILVDKIELVEDDTPPPAKAKVAPKKSAPAPAKPIAKVVPKKSKK